MRYRAGMNGASPLLLLLLVPACAPPIAAQPADQPPPPPAPQPAPQPALITDAECLAKGGRVITEQTYAHLDRRRHDDEARTPFRICKVPSPQNGASCRGDADCEGGRCFCDGALSRPDPQNDPALLALDDQPTTGRCSDEPVASGSWWCLVVDGKANLHGIIVD